MKNKISLILAGLVILSFPGTSIFALNKEAVTNLYSSYLKGIFYADNEDYQAALKEFHKVKKIDPQSIHIRLKIATFFIRLGEIDKAEKELKEAKSIAPDNFDVSLSLIFLYSYTHKDKELEIEYENFLKSAVEFKPEDLKISEYLAQFYFYKKDIPRAIEIYEKILEKDPAYVEGIFWLGYFYEETANRDKAIELWKRGLAINSLHAPILNSLGYIYAEQGVHLDEAEDMIKKALIAEPDNGAYLDSLGWVYFKKKKYKEAEDCLLKAIELVKDPVIYEHLGDLYVELGDLEKAVNYYREGFNYFPGDKKLKDKLEKYGREDKEAEDKS